LAIFAGIPLLVIIIVSLLVLAPGWVKGPRYRPGLPWEADNVWFGVGVGARPEAATVDAGPPAGPAETAGSADTAEAGPSGTSAPSRATRGAHPDQRPGGASAGW
ncbi:MAG: hypothetical protein QOI51_2134, partial [Nocardioidaceae bacterium]|nr:hypothetical protein [Nocardioidaceae bacterium]